MLLDGSDREVQLISQFRIRGPTYEEAQHVPLSPRHPCLSQLFWYLGPIAPRRVCPFPIESLQQGLRRRSNLAEPCLNCVMVGVA